LIDQAQTGSEVHW